MKQAYKLAFIDLDDTLLGPDKTISAANSAALEKLRSAGIKVVAASGRHHHNISKIKGLGAQDWILSSHGSVVRNSATNETILEMSIPYEVVAEVYALAPQLNMSVLVYHTEGVFYETDSTWVAFYAKQVGDYPKHAIIRDLPRNGFQKVLLTGDPDLIQQHAASLKARFSDRVTVMETNPELLEFFAPDASKRVGAKTLAKKLEVERHETLAFGDGNNDVDILRWAGCSVAMSHGRSSAREAATYVSGTGSPDTAFARAVDLVLVDGR